MFGKNARFKSDNLRFKYINKYLNGQDILDIGSTEGYLHNLLKRNNSFKNFYTLDNSGGANFKMDLDKPKKINQKFDTIIAGEIIEHLESPIQFIKYCKSLLKKDGHLIITTPNAIGLQYIKSPSWCVNYKDYRGHTQAFTLPMLVRICKDNGLKVIYKDYINAFWIYNPLQLISLVIKRLRPDLIVVVKNYL